MKYQITCDNCGKQFIIDAEPGKTVECQCPGCRGVMQITLPNVAKGERYEPPRHTGDGKEDAWAAETVDGDSHPNRRWLWIGVAVVLVVVAAIGLAMYFTSSTKPVEVGPAPVDTIPYEQPVETEQPQQRIDTIVEQRDEPEEDVREYEVEPDEPQEVEADTVEALE